MFSKKPDAPVAAPARTPRNMAGNSTFSVIGADVVIKGDIVASADLHVDGRIEGDIACAALVQGEGGQVEGGIAADNARLAGTVKGSIRAKQLAILASAQIEGDVEYEALTIEQGAKVEGRLSQAGSKPVSVSSQPADDSDERHLSLAG